MKVDKEQYVGITETSDPSFHLELFDNLCKANIIVTKRLTNKLNEKLIEYKDKCILHLTCTGYGGSVLEPFVPTLEQTHIKFKELIDGGFPIEHVVLRIDPCIPTLKGLEKVRSVIGMFKNDGIKRVRFSVLDMYKHVKDRFNEKSIPLPYDTFHAPLENRMDVYNALKVLGFRYGFEVETCGEPDIESVSCISQRDIDILGLTDEIELFGDKEQRKSCHCPANKHQLIKGKPSQCENHCLYCFWK